MMRMYIGTVLVVLAVVLALPAVAADCACRDRQTQTGYEWSASSQGPASGCPNARTSERDTGSTYMGRYEQHNARCLFNQIRDDHREIRAHLNALDNAPRAERQAHWTKLRAAILPHMQAEERTLYPALHQSRSGVNWGMYGEEEHAAAASLFQKLDGAEMSSDRWTARFMVFSEMVRHHITEEEDRIFDAARRNLNNEQLSALCADFMSERTAAVNNLPPWSSTASYQSSSDLSSSPNASTSYSSASSSQCHGFDDLAMQDMAIQCPSCHAVVGTVTPVSSSCVVWESSSQPVTTGVESTETMPAAQQPAVTGTETIDQEDAIQRPSTPTGTLSCPRCGAAMGTVCPAGPSATMQTPPMQEAPTSMPQSSSSSSTSSTTSDSTHDTRY